MSAHEFTFGKTECEVHIDDRNYLARLFVWEESGHAWHPRWEGRGNNACG